MKILGTFLNLCKRWLIGLYYCSLCAMRSRLRIFLLLQILVRTVLRKFHGLLPKVFGDSAKVVVFLRFSGYIRIDEQNGWLLIVQHTLCVTDKIPQYSQENTCARVSFFIKVAGLRLATSLKSDSSAGVFVWIFQNV